MHLTVLELDDAGVFAIPSQNLDGLMIDAREENLEWCKRVRWTQPIRVTAVRQSLKPNEFYHKSYQKSAASLVQHLSNS